MIAKVGDRVRIRYTHMQNAGAATLEPPKPRVLEFTIGGSHVMPGLSQCVMGMRQGEQKCVTLQPAEAFGTVQTRLIREIARQSIHSTSPLRVGMRLARKKPGGVQGQMARIVELKHDSVVVDGNHPCAGRAVNLAMYLMSVDSSAEANRSKPQFDLGGES